MIKNIIKPGFAWLSRGFVWSNLTTFKLWLLSLLLTISLAEAMAVSIQIFMGGHVDYDYLLTVLVFALLAASVVGAMFITFMDKQAVDRHFHFQDKLAQSVHMSSSAMQPGDIVPKVNSCEQPLTNKQWFLAQLEKALATSGRTNKCGALLSIDLGYSRLTPDQGMAGKLLSQQIAQRLTQCVRKSDTVTQMGNAEFAVLLENLGEDCAQAAMQAQRVAQQVLEKFDLPLRLKNYAQHCTPRIGICMFDKQATAPHAVFKNAGLAMYQAVASGKCTIRFYDSELQALIDTHTQQQAELQHGWQAGQLKLHYQPQVGFDGNVIGVEALLRWQHPQRGLLQAHEFLALAEGSGLSAMLDNWVLTTACAQLASWAQSSATAHLMLSVNVSAAQFRQADFVEGLLALLKTAAASPGRLMLELGENTLAAAAASAKINALKTSGIGICLDNFGTNAASLSCLQKGRIDEIKIDRSLVGGLLNNPADSAVVRAIIAVGAGLGITVVAQGVEHRRQRELLAQHGCHHYQGYHMGEVMPIRQFDELLQTQQARARLSTS